jgi:ABC-type transporter Mla subunit MlaD
MMDLSKAVANVRRVSEVLREQLDATPGSDALLAKIHGITDSLADAAGSVARELHAADPNALIAGVHRTVHEAEGIAGDLRVQLEPDDPATLMGKAHKTIEHTQRAAGHLAQATDPNADGSVMGKVHGTMDDVNAMTTDAKPKLSRLLGSAANSAEMIEGYTKKDLADLLGTLRESNTEILRIAKNFGTASEEVKEILVLNREGLDETLDNLRQVSVHLKATSKDVRRNPWKLLHRPDKDEVREQQVYDAARAFLAGAEQLDQAVGKLRALRKLQDEQVQADDPQVEKIRNHLKRSFEKFTEVERALWEKLKE